MTTNIKATNLDFTPAIKDYIIKRVNGLSKFIKKFDEVGDLKLDFEIARTTRHHKKGNVFYAEANLHLPKKILRAEYSDADIRAAIDKVKDRLKTELIKYKELHQ